MYLGSLSYAVAAERLKAELETLKAELGTWNSEPAPANAQAVGEAAETSQATAAFDSLARRLEAMAEAKRPPWWRWLRFAD